MPTSGPLISLRRCTVSTTTTDTMTLRRVMTTILRSKTGITRAASKQMKLHFSDGSTRRQVRVLCALVFFKGQAHCAIAHNQPVSSTIFSNNTGVTSQAQSSANTYPPVIAPSSPSRDRQRVFQLCLHSLVSDLGLYRSSTRFQFKVVTGSVHQVGHISMGLTFWKPDKFWENDSNYFHLTDDPSLDSPSVTTSSGSSMDSNPRVLNSDDDTCSRPIFADQITEQPQYYDVSRLGHAYQGDLASALSGPVRFAQREFVIPSKCCIESNVRRRP